jgi:NAD(P)H-dependent flavin oxidoreductase YrpB (nitropropane dioxygenase family)
VVSRSLSGKNARSIRSLWIDDFDASGLDPLPMPLQSYLVYGTLVTADRVGRHDIHPGLAGQGIGAVSEIRPAGDVVRRLVDDAVAVRRRLSGGRW